MRGRQEAVLQRAQTVLSYRSVRYKVIPESLLPELLSTRLRGQPLTFSFSQDFSPGIYLSEVGANKLLVVVSSKKFGCALRDRDNLQARALDYNAQEIPYLWKVEERGGRCFPLAELTLYISENTDAVDLQIWSACQAIYTFFNLTVSVLLPVTISSATEVLKSFLIGKGIGRIDDKETSTGRNLLVVLGIESETENLSHLRFPLSIDISRLIVFRATFAVKSVRVDVKEPFRSAVLQLASQLNWVLDQGHYDFSFNQLHLTFKVHYQCLTQKELEDCVGGYYEGLCSAYAATVKAIAKLHQQSLSENTEIEDVFCYFRYVDEKVKGDTYFEKVNYEVKSELQEDICLFNQLLGNRLLADYFLPNPYILSQSGTALYRKNALPLCHFTVAAANLSIGRSRLYPQVIDLYEKLRSGGIFPAKELLYVRDNKRLTLLLGKGLHQNSLRFLKECIDILLLTYEGLDMEKTDYLVQFSSFYDFSQQEVIGSLLTAHIGSEAYILHPLSGLISNFAMWLCAYRSYWSIQQGNANPVIGWTYSNDFLPISKEEQSESLFLCERANHKLWTWQSSLAECFQLLSSLDNLHQTGQFHLFLSPAILRKIPETQEMTLALPCGKLTFAEFLHSFLGQQCAHYQAPEVGIFLAGGPPMQRPEKADIYNVSRVIAAVVGACGGALQDLLRRAEASDPEERPELQEIKEAFQKYWEEQTASRTLAGFAPR